MNRALIWILVVWMYGVLSAAQGQRSDGFDLKGPRENLPPDDDESNDYSGVSDFFGWRNRYNSDKPSQNEESFNPEESFIPDIEIFLPDVYNEDDAPKSDDGLGESNVRFPSYDYGVPLNLQAAPSDTNKTSDSTDLDESYIRSILDDIGIHPGSSYYDDYGTYDDDYETTTAEPEVETLTSKSTMAGSTSGLPREPVDDTVHDTTATMTTTSTTESHDTSPAHSTATLTFTEKEPTPPLIVPTTSTTTQKTSTKPFEPTTTPTTTSTTSTSSTSMTSSTSTTSTTPPTTTTKTSTTVSITTSTTTTTKPTTSTATTRSTPKTSTTTTTLPPPIHTQPAVQSTHPTVPDVVVVVQTEAIDIPTEEDKFTSYSRPSSREEEISSEEEATTSMSEVLPKKVQFSTVVLIISLISVVIVLVFVLVVVIFVRARLHRQGKYDIPPDSDGKSGVAESSSKTKFANDIDSDAVVVPVQYNNSVA